MPNWREELVEGYQRFRRGDYIGQKALYERLGTKGQKPKILLIACSDSRVDPTDIFDAYPGEMFVIRNVANFIPPSGDKENHDGVMSAVEYAVRVLGVKAIIVMGHESCGGIDGCLNGLPDSLKGSHIEDWVNLLEPAKKRVKTKGLTGKSESLEMEFEGVRESISNLMSFDFVKEAVEGGTLTLQGAYFSIISAKLLFANAQGEFEIVPEK